MPTPPLQLYSRTLNAGTHAPARVGGGDAHAGDVLQVAQLVQRPFEGGAIPEDGLEGVLAVVGLFCFCVCGGGVVV